MAGRMKDSQAAGIKKLQSRVTTKRVLFIVGGLVLLAILAATATSTGAASLSLGEVFRAVVARVLPFTGVESTPYANAIVMDLRLPRVLMAIVAGMGLAISGAAMQGVMRNPLVSPFTIGISSAAGFGAALAIVLGVGLVDEGRYLIIANAFLFAMGAAFAVYLIAQLRGTSPETLILAGIAVMYLFSAGTSFLQYMGSAMDIAAVVHWLFGSFVSANWSSLLVISVVFLVCLPLLMKYSWDLNALAEGDETATSLGVNATRVRTVVMALAALLTAAIICFTGIIGFVCLVAPHITRLVIGGDYRFLLPCSCIVGALLLLGADTVGRTVAQPIEIPVGILTSFIGVPMFLYLLMTRKRRYWQ